MEKHVVSQKAKQHTTRCVVEKAKPTIPEGEIFMTVHKLVCSCASVYGACLGNILFEIRADIHFAFQCSIFNRRNQPYVAEGSSACFSFVVMLFH